jgi:hypothetical protein
MESFKQLKSYKEKQRINGQKGGRPKTQTIPKKRSSLKIEDRSIKIEDRKKKIEVEVKVEAVKPYQTENFDLAWNNWKEYKRLELGFNYKTIHSEQAALTQLGNKTTSEQHAIDSINNAMAKGWKGIYPEKQLTNGSKKNNKNGQQYSDEFLHSVVKGLQPF